MNNHVNNLESFDIFQSHMHVARNGNPNNPNRPTLYKVPMLHIYNYAVALPIKLEFQKTFAIINFLLSTRIGLDKAALETIKTTLQGVFEKPYTTLDAQTSIDVALTGITNLIKDHKNEVLFKALKHKKEHLILMLIALPWFDLNAKNTSHGNRTPLMYAAEKGYLKTARFLLQKNVNIDDKKSDGLTPLMIATYYKHNDTVALLLENGANINEKDHDGWSALMFAAWDGHKDTVALLLEKGANINDKDQEGLTALMRTACVGQKDTIELLLEKGANINDKDRDEWTALMFAARHGNKDAVALLLENGANINDTSFKGLTALMQAETQGHQEIVEILKAHEIKKTTMRYN